MARSRRAKRPRRTRVLSKRVTQRTRGKARPRRTARKKRNSLRGGSGFAGAVPLQSIGGRPEAPTRAEEKYGITEMKIRTSVDTDELRRSHKSGDTYAVIEFLRFLNSTYSEDYMAGFVTLTVAGIADSTEKNVAATVILHSIAIFAGATLTLDLAFGGLTTLVATAGAAISGSTLVPALADKYFERKAAKQVSDTKLSTAGAERYTLLAMFQKNNPAFFEPVSGTGGAAAEPEPVSETGGAAAEPVSPKGDLTNFSKLYTKYCDEDTSNYSAVGQSIRLSRTADQLRTSISGIELQSLGGS